jgi:hypothetical protein
MSRNTETLRSYYQVEYCILVIVAAVDHGHHQSSSIFTSLPIVVLADILPVLVHDKDLPELRNGRSFKFEGCRRRRAAMTTK